MAELRFQRDRVKLGEIVEAHVEKIVPRERLELLSVGVERARSYRCLKHIRVSMEGPASPGCKPVRLGTASTLVPHIETIEYHCPGEGSRRGRKPLGYRGDC